MISARSRCSSLKSLRVVALRLFEKTTHPVALRGADQGTAIEIRERRAGHKRSETLAKAREQRLVDRCLDEQP